MKNDIAYAVFRAMRHRCFQLCLRYGVLILLSALLGVWQCTNTANPLQADETGIDLRLLFQADNITRDAALNKTTILFQTATIRALSSNNADTLAVVKTTVKEDSTFSTQMRIPLGKSFFIEAAIYEHTTGMTQLNSGPYLAWFGKSEEIALQASAPAPIVLRLYPLPIAGRQVVLYLQNAMEFKNGPAVEIAMSNLNPIRAVQFDLLYSPELSAPTFTLADRCRNFTLEKAPITNKMDMQKSCYRIVIFDPVSGSLIPVVKDLFYAEPVVRIIFRTMTTYVFSMQNAVVTDSKLYNYKVYLVNNLLESHF